MLLRKLTCLGVLVATACSIKASAPALKSMEYVRENLKQLDSLINKKKSAKHVLSLDILFDEYVVDTKELLKTLNEQSQYEKQDSKKEEIVKQIAHYMAVLQKLLTIMNSNQPEPLETYCSAEPRDSLWGSLCGDRPAKRVWRDHFKKEERSSSGSVSSSSSIKIRHNDEKDEELPLNVRTP